jgi:hypothetical protein
MPLKIIIQSSKNRSGFSLEVGDFIRPLSSISFARCIISPDWRIISHIGCN